MNHNIVIDLDVLLDTRIASLFQINPDEALMMLARGFTSRTTDDLSGVTDLITNEQYKEAYDNRDVETLKVARITSYIFELARLVKSLIDDISKDNTRIDKPCIVLNYYPYKDLDDDILAHLVYAIEQYVTDTIEIATKYLTPNDLRLGNMKESNILTYITYDFQKWFEGSFNVGVGRNGIICFPRCTIIAPKIMPKKGAFDDFDLEAKKILQNKTPFEFMKLYWAPFFGIEYCPIELMSLVDTAIV